MAWLVADAAAGCHQREADNALDWRVKDQIGFEFEGFPLDVYYTNALI